MSDASARREFDVARRIHGGMRENQSDRPEILSEMSEETAARGRRMARQVGLAFIVLVAMNVLLGLVYIAHHESHRLGLANGKLRRSKGKPIPLQME